MPLVGATVIVITGTQPGYTTDANGKFAIAAAPGQRLSVSTSATRRLRSK
ncbi:MAG: hypothetical protein ACLRMJ_00245 [Alistipes finegoldii]